ncbi:hypothetical protein C1645_800694 [Glomus cerebriforme]|uniref:C2H2-type domain-containing protein n=1 Tax=Glomus cerebriforme TaxID=658196 RepID=A0A397TVY8_9GLOM|nr:hypothetical protein C1645_800694 [Glomus cerebriforme]
METKESVVKEGFSKSSNQHEIKSSNYKTPSPNNLLHDLIERQAKEFEEFGKRMSLELQNFYKEYLIRQKGIGKFDNDTSEIEKVCKEYEEKIYSQSQLIESLKVRIENLETNSIIKDQDIKDLRNEFDESVKILSEQENNINNHINHKKNDSLTDQFSEILNMENFTDSISEINGDDAIFLHEIIETRSGISLKCKKCDKTFKSHVRFRYHVKEKHQYNWLCLVCYQVFLSGRDRGIHMRKHHTKDFPCTLCTKKCYDIIGLREHFRAKHPGEKFPQLPTNLSNFTNLSHLSQTSVPLQSLSTSQSNVEKFIHEIIPYQFPSSKIPPFQLKCKLCEGIFNNYSLFNDHAKILHGFKLLCLYCSRVFFQKKLRNKHMKEDHIYNCQVCGKEFHSEGGLISHCKAKKHQYNIEDIYSSLKGDHSANDDDLSDLNKNLESLISLTNDDDNIKENQIQEDDSKVESDVDSDLEIKALNNVS